MKQNNMNNNNNKYNTLKQALIITNIYIYIVPLTVS